VGQNFVWVGQARVWVGHGLPGLIARTASGKLLLHSAKLIELRQGIQKLQVKTLVGTTLVGPPCSEVCEIDDS